MTTVAIVGAGELGGAVAHALARREAAGRLLLVDAAGSVAAGKALDILQSGAVDGFHTQLAGTDDLTRITACSVCVIADRSASPSTEWSGDEGLAFVSRLLPYLGDAPIVLAGTTSAPLMEALVREAGVRRERLIGSAPEALASAVRAIVAMEACCSPREVLLTVLGCPPSGFVIPWSEASIGGLALDRVLSQAQIARIEARATRLWPPGAYTLGLAAAVIVEALLRSSRQSHTVLTVLGGELGARDRAAALPSLLTTSGVARTQVPRLNMRERVRLETVLGS